MKKRVSSTDVAKEAGVSRATVSYVLNNVQGVKIKPETKEKVLAAAKKLGYHPDSVARAMKVKKSMCIGVVTKREVNEERFTNVLKGIKDVLSRNDYSIMLCSDEINSRGYAEYYSYYHENKIDGVIFLSHIESIDIPETKRIVEMCKADKIPCVFADYHINDSEANCVDIDYFHGGYIAAKHLTHKQHEKYIYIAPGLKSVQENERLAGVKKALDEADVKEENLIIEHINGKKDWEALNIKSLLKKGVTAVITSWFTFGSEFLQIANKTGISIPKQIEVIALAGGHLADFTYPRLTTSDLPLNEIGSRSAEALIHSLTDNANPINLKLQCQLRNRETG